MTDMIVCMNYTDSGERYIAKIWYDMALTAKELAGIAYEQVNYFNEVYVVRIDPNSQDFINEIVLNGCRFS